MSGRTSVARGTVLGIAAQFWQMLTAFVLYNFLSKQLGPAGFGEWRVTLSVLNYFELLIYTGVVQVASKHLAENPEDRPLVERASYLAQAILGLTLFAALQLSAPLIARALNEPGLTPYIRIAAFDLPFIAALMLASNLRLGQHHFARQALSMMVYSTAKFIAIGVLVWQGFSVPGALVGNAISSVVGFAVMFMPWQRAVVPAKAALTEARGMGIKAVPYFLQSTIGGVQGESALWFVQAMRGSAAAGLFGSATVLADIPSFLFAGLNRVLFPSVARAGAQDDRALVSRYVTQGVRLALLVTVLGVAVVAATGPALLTFIYTASFAAAAPALLVLMVGSIGHNVHKTCADILMAQGRRRLAVGIVAAAVVLEVALLWVVAPRFGIVGAATVATLSALVAGFVAAWSLRELMGVRVVWTLIRSAVAAGVVYAGLALLGPRGVWLIPAYAGASALYAGLLLLLREVDRADLDSLRGVVARRRRSDREAA